MAKHITQYALKDLTQGQFTILLLDASHSLGWRMGFAKGNFVLTVPRTAWTNGEKLTIQIEDETAVIESKSNQWQVTGAKKNEKNLVDITTKLDELRAENTPEQLTERYNTFIEEQTARAKGLEERIKTNTLTADEKISLGSGGRYVTYTLIGVNILIFILMVLSGAGFIDFSVDSLYKWGGNVRSLTAGGEWYRLITNIFLHGGLIHVLFNMYALLLIGIYLEPLLGRWRYLTVYLACGIFASLTSTWWSGDRISVGASGAIFGLYGVFLALLTTNYLDKGMRKPMLQSIGVFVVYNLVYGLKGGVDNAAHVGGLISGVAFGYLYYFIFLKRKDNLIVSITLTIAITIAGVCVVLPGINDDSKKVSDSIDRFIPLQEKALAPIKIISDTSFSSTIADELTNESLPIWKGWQLALDSSDNYKIPDEMRSKIKMFKRYVDLRIEQTDLVIQRETQRTYQYDSSYLKVSTAINNLLDSLNAK